MKKWLIVMYSFIFIHQGHTQHLEGYLSVDTRAGFSTNTLLNPFFGEWDRSEHSGYGYVSPMGLMSYYNSNFSAGIAGGAAFEMFTGDRQSLYGGYGMLNGWYRITETFSAGIESGASKVSTTFDRNMYWVQPAISWSPSLFTRVKARVGSSFRTYGNIQDEQREDFTEKSRFDLYGLEIETWPNFKWQLKGGLYGNLDAPADNLSLIAAVEHHLTRKLRITARAGMDQYKFQFTTQNGTGGGLPPVGGPGGGNNTVIVEDTDRIYRIGAGATYQVHPNLTLFANADQLNLNSSVSDESIEDYHLSAGLRIQFRPSFRNSDEAEPEWHQNDNQVLTLRINYSGDGQLYLLGDFNDWSTPGITLIKQSNRRYVAQLSLDPGAYEYKILLIESNEEKWIEFTDETFTVNDGFGGENGLILIE
jgi:hypothetical protein